MYDLLLCTKCFLLFMFLCRIQDLCGLSPNAFISDLHLPNLLVFSAKTDFHDHYLYKAGHIILQDKVQVLLVILQRATVVLVSFPS